MCASKMLGVIIPPVAWSAPPVNSELILSSAVSKPMRPHVHCLRSLWLDVVGYDCLGGSIVRLHGRFGLWVPHFLERSSSGHCLACIDVHGPDFCFRCGGHDGPDDLGDVEHGSVVGRVFVVSGHEKMAFGAAACLGYAEVGSITVDG